MSQDFKPGDFLVFQLESGFAVLRVLTIEPAGSDTIWHLTAFGDLFPDVDSAESAAQDPSSLTVSHAHIALTNRAFLSTQVARLGNVPLSSDEEEVASKWLDRPADVSDRSVRLMLGLR